MAQKIKIISGGQTGADYGALVGARLSGVETGGTAPKGFRTENGPNPALGTVFGLVEHSSSSYPPRTACNVRDADVTVWMGNIGSPGWACTKKFTEQYDKPFYPFADFGLSNIDWFCDHIEEHGYRVINFAGNRESKNPGLQEKVCDFVQTMVKELRRRT